MNSDQLSSLSLVCIVSPIIETGSHVFCLLPFQLPDSCVCSKFPQSNYGHVKRTFTVQAALKTALSTKYYYP